VQGIGRLFRFFGFLDQSNCHYTVYFYRVLAGGRHLLTGRTFDEIGAVNVCWSSVESLDRLPVWLHEK
jgi:hypothetical protein